MKLAERARALLSTDADFGLAGAVLVALHVARITLPGLAYGMFASTHELQQKVNDARLTACFVGSLIATALCVAVVVVARRKLKKRALDAILVAAAVALGSSASWQLGVATLVAVVVLAPLVAAHDAADPRATGEVDVAATPWRDALLLLGAEIVAAGFGVACANAFRRTSTSTALAVMAGAAVVILGSVVVVARGKRLDALGRRAIAGTPLLACALFGVARTPELAWVAAAFAVSVVLAIALARGRIARIDRALAAAASVLAPLALVAVASTPLALRTLRSANNAQHEAFHSGWIEGVLHGRFFQADVDNIYGLLREWILTAYVAVAGFTLENLRVAFVLVNIAGALLLLLAARPWLKHRPWLTLAFAYALVFGSVIRCIAFADQAVSVGWADLTRCGLAVAALVGSLRAMQQDRPRPLVVAACGALLGCALLYSEEFGVTALAATWLAFACALAASLLGLGPPRASLRATARVFAWHASGVFAVLALTIAIYAAFGKARLLLSTSTILVRVMLNGEMASPQIQITADSFAHPVALLTKYTSVLPAGALANADAELLMAPAIYVVATAVLVVAALTKRWSARRTIELGILAFGVVSQRVTISRPDIYHMLSATPPALLLGVSLADNALRSGRHARRVAVVAAAALFAFVAERGAGLRALKKHDVELAEHHTQPLAILPRAGHIVVERPLVDLVRYIDAHSARNEAIFVRAPNPGMDGPHIYFLADRRMSTSFAMMQELWTSALKEQAYQELVADPPRLVVGDDEGYSGGKIARFVRDNYTQVAQIGNWPVYARRMKGALRP